MTFALARSLLLADAVTPDALAQALLVSATRGTSLVRALLATRAIDAMRLEQQLERGEAPTMRHVAPVMSLVQHLPPGLCERLLALPVRRDPRTGTIDVAIVDARDPHPVEEMAHWLRAPVRMVRTSLAAMDAALRRMHAKPEAGPRPLAAPIWVPPVSEPPRDMTKTPAYGSPVVDESQLSVPDDDGKPTEIHDFGVADPNIPFALQQRSVLPVPIVEVGPPPEELDTVLVEPEPVIELRRRASPSALAQPPQLAEPVLDLRRRKSSQPIAPNAPVAPFPDVAPMLEAIRTATDRDAILEHVVAAVSTVARKVAVLAVRKDALVGWTCSPELADRATWRTARISPSLSAVLSKALEGSSATLARIPKDGTHAPLLAAMKVPPLAEVAMAAIRVEGKAVALVLADEVGDTMTATKRLEEVAQLSGESLGRLLREKRK
jgi:hypothetical protein